MTITCTDHRAPVEWGPIWNERSTLFSNICDLSTEQIAAQSSEPLPKQQTQFYNRATQLINELKKTTAQLKEMQKKTQDCVFCRMVFTVQRMDESKMLFRAHAVQREAYRGLHHKENLQRFFEMHAARDGNPPQNSYGALRGGRGAHRPSPQGEPSLPE